MAPNEAPKIFYTWKRFEKDIAKTAGALNDKNSFVNQTIGVKIKNIYGIPRGGLIVAAKLSHLLNLPLILDYKKITPATLVVDDIVDTGRTLVSLKRRIRRCKSMPPVYALFWARFGCKMNPTFASHIKAPAQWVIFPWETLGSSKYDNTFKFF